MLLADGEPFFSHFSPFFPSVSKKLLSLQLKDARAHTYTLRKFAKSRTATKKRL